MAWGDKNRRQWGNGSTMAGSASPVEVSGYNGPVSVASVVNPHTVLRETIAHNDAPLRLVEGIGPLIFN
ncbi:MAG TPA: hypothetical protein HPP97_13315 [Desulfuromonadales bacterium]|nr:hypothetical protein [Desulfuromonadales bacterium]